MGFSLVAVSEGYSLAVVFGLLIAVVPLVAAHNSRHGDSVIVAHGLSCFEACRVFPEEGIKPVSPALAAGFLSSIPSGKSLFIIFYCYL